MSNLFSLKRKKIQSTPEPSVDTTFELEKPATIEKKPRIDTEILKQSIAEKMKAYRP